MKVYGIIAAALLAVCPFVHADTSYLLIQGPFGSGGAEETYQWQVNYQAGFLKTGQDLLTAVFGPATLNGTFTDGFGGEFSKYTAGNATQGFEYMDFGGGSFFSISFTLNSTTYTMDPSYAPGWNYYVAGGSGPFQGGAYPDGVWTFANDGQTARKLSDGSFDAWVFGATFPAVEVNGVGNLPVTGNFSAATVVNVPEPGSVALFILGGVGGIVALRRKRQS